MQLRNKIHTTISVWDEISFNWSKSTDNILYQDRFNMEIIDWLKEHYSRYSEQNFGQFLNPFAWWYNIDVTNMEFEMFSS